MVSEREKLKRQRQTYELKKLKERKKSGEKDYYVQEFWDVLRQDGLKLSQSTLKRDLTDEFFKGKVKIYEDGPLRRIKLEED